MNGTQTGGRKGDAWPVPLRSRRLAQTPRAREQARPPIASGNGLRWPRPLYQARADGCQGFQSRLRPIAMTSAGAMCRR
jgi:hypothetical protein